MRVYLLELPAQNSACCQGHAEPRAKGKGERFSASGPLHVRYETGASNMLIMNVITNRNFDREYGSSYSGFMTVGTINNLLINNS